MGTHGLYMHKNKYKSKVVFNSDASQYQLSNKIMLIATLKTLGIT